MNKSYGIHDKWTDLDKVNNIRVDSVDGVIENITVNGEPAGGGGDLTIATLTLEGSGGFEVCTFYEEYEVGSFTGIDYEGGDVKTFPIILYKGLARLRVANNTDIIETSGSIVRVVDSYYNVTGDCYVKAEMSIS